jgi:hypothetical protein
MNCINELLSLDQSITFIIFFDLIKKCFERLKKTNKKKTPKNVTKLYSYRVTLTLKLIVSFLGFCEKKKEDFKLISEISYPLIELILSLLDLYPHVRYYPLFIHYFKMLLEIQQKLNLKIPISTRIFSLMNNKSILASIPASKSVKGFDFEIKLKVDKDSIRSNFFWTDVCKEFSCLIVKEVFNVMFRGKCY